MTGLEFYAEMPVAEGRRAIRESIRSKVAAVPVADNEGRYKGDRFFGGPAAEDEPPAAVDAPETPSRPLLRAPQGPQGDGTPPPDRELTLAEKVRSVAAAAQFGISVTEAADRIREGVW